MIVRLNAVICGTGQGTAEEMRGGNRVIDTANSEATGIGYCWTAYVGFVIGVQVVVPLWKKVDSGSRFVVIAIRPAQDFAASVLTTVTVVGLARISAIGLGVEDGIDR